MKPTRSLFIELSSSGFSTPLAVHFGVFFLPQKKDCLPCSRPALCYGDRTFGKKFERSLFNSSYARRLSGSSQARSVRHIPHCAQIRIKQRQENGAQKVHLSVSSSFSSSSIPDFFFPYDLPFFLPPFSSNVSRAEAKPGEQKNLLSV